MGEQCSNKSLFTKLSSRLDGFGPQAVVSDLCIRIALSYCFDLKSSPNFQKVLYITCIIMWNSCTYVYSCQDYVCVCGPLIHPFLPVLQTAMLGLMAQLQEEKKLSSIAFSSFSIFCMKQSHRKPTLSMESWDVK